MEKRLGKGLGALIPGRSAGSEGAEKIGEIKVSRIKPNKSQPRKNFDSDKLKELMDSIREKGIIQPVIVRPSSETAVALARSQPDRFSPRLMSNFSRSYMTPSNHRNGVSSIQKLTTDSARA